MFLFMQYVVYSDHIIKGIISIFISYLYFIMMNCTTNQDIKFWSHDLQSDYLSIELARLVREGHTIVYNEL